MAEAAKILVFPERQGEWELVETRPRKGEVPSGLKVWIHAKEGWRARPHGEAFQIQFTDYAGKRHTKTFSTLAKAERELRAQEGLLDKGVVAEQEADRRVKLSALAESYKLYAQNSAPKSYDWIELVWRVHLEPAFGHITAGRLDIDMVEKYRAERLAAGASPSTVNREQTVLRAIYGHAVDTGKISSLPRFPKKLAEPPPRKGFLNHEQYEALRAACALPWLRALLAIAYNFGFRKSELLGLRVSQVDLKAKQLRLWVGETKNDEGRMVAMTADVLEALTECVKGKQAEDFVFTWNDGRPVKDFRGAWANMCTAAGVPIKLHDFRRTASRNLIRAGVSRDVARRITGHKTDSIFSRYNITDESDLEDAARKLEIAAELQRKKANVE